MKELIIASNNPHKIEEIKAILAEKFDVIYSLSEKGADVEIEETGTTFEQNALIKARAIAALTGLAALADDSGLEVDALGGAPGVYSARYAGEPCDDAKNNAKLLAALDKKTDRSARFVSVVALCFPDGTAVTARGDAEGEILRDFRGLRGFGYDPLFYSRDLNKTFAEATAEEKNSISHRARALAALLKKL